MPTGPARRGGSRCSRESTRAQQTGGAMCARAACALMLLGSAARLRVRGAGPAGDDELWAD
eukprot:6562478-Prymnesium_polylepis.1